MGGGVLCAQSYKKRAQSKLICACAYFAHSVYKQLLCTCKTSTKERVSHTPIKNSYFRDKCAKWAIVSRVYTRGRDKLRSVSTLTTASCTHVPRGAFDSIIRHRNAGTSDVPTIVYTRGRNGLKPAWTFASVSCTHVPRRVFLRFLDNGTRNKTGYRCTDVTRTDFPDADHLVSHCELMYPQDVVRTAPQWGKMDKIL